MYPNVSVMRHREFDWSISVGISHSGTLTHLFFLWTQNSRQVSISFIRPQFYSKYNVTSLVVCAGG